MAEYINREDLIAACKNKHFAVSENDHPYDVVARVGKYFKQCVSEAPAADVSPRAEVARKIVKDLLKSLKPYRTEYARTEPVTIENLHCSPIGARYVIPSYELEAVIHLILEKYTEGE